MSNIEIINEPAPAPRPSGKKIGGEMKLTYVEEKSQKVLHETVTSGWKENERRLREDAQILNVGEKE